MIKRIAFFAHFDPDGIIDAYVLRYLNELIDSEIDNIYFATDTDLRPSELNKLPNQVCAVNSARHGAYDFGSWRLCLNACLKDCGESGFTQIDELILCNDSCYGPLFSLADMFDDMQSRECDYWGITQVEYSGGYYPSYFLVMRKTVLADPDFHTFIEGVGAFRNKKDYCERYEVGLNRLLERKGYKGSCYLNAYSHLCHSSALTLSDEVFKAGMPFIRVMTARSNPGGIRQLGERIREVCSEYGYPSELIVLHLDRVSPEFNKYWRYKYGDIDRKFLNLLRIRQKPNPEKDKVRLKVWILGIPVLYCTFSMKYIGESFQKARDH